ncbi:MAG: ribonuclease P protein component [Rubrivivax sp.]
MIGRLLRKCDFERTLAAAPCLRSAHFAVHYLHACPTGPSRAASPIESGKLYTGDTPIVPTSVDNPVAGHWLGHVIPKRHARRSVTRNMLRRQVRAAMLRHEAGLRPGLWLVRLRQPFTMTVFASADSGALRCAAALELDRLLARAVP